MVNYDRFSHKMPWEDYEPQEFCKCDCCGEPIYFNEKYVEWNEDIICMECIFNSTYTAC